jgi:superfamily I DNA/RNA helicase
MMIDFTDMLWLTHKLVDKSTFPKYDVVFIDEVQDLNPLQREMILNLISKGGRFVAVGDQKQAIYSFMGSSLESFKKLQNMPNTTVMPLSVSYRCASSIIEYANDIFPGLEPFEGNPEGIIRKGSLSEIRSGDIVACRNNLPLVETFIDLLGEGRKSHIMGRDFGKSLSDLVDRINSVTELPELLHKKAKSLIERGVQKPMFHKSYIALKEKIDIINLLMKDHDYRLMDLKDLFNDLFVQNSNENGITLLTIHKSKGLESERVFIVGYHELLPSQYAKTPLEKYQEECLKYVAVTRAKKELVFVDYKPKNANDDDSGYEF